MDNKDWVKEFRKVLTKKLVGVSQSFDNDTLELIFEGDLIVKINVKDVKCMTYQ
jgi:hypothetical protein